MSPTCVVQPSVKSRAPRASKAQTEENARPAPPFTFINLSEPNQRKDKELKRTVRSHAMRAYNHALKQKAATDQEGGTVFILWNGQESRSSETAHARRRQPTSVKRAQDVSSSNCVASNHAECNRLVCSKQMIKSTSKETPQTLIGGGMNDPFNTYPIRGSTRYIDYVLNHFVSAVAQKYLPMALGDGRNPLTKTWIPNAMADPLLFAATLNVAAIHLDVIRCQPINSQTLARKGETIHLINKRLAKSPQTLTNEIIGSVVMLAAWESLAGDGKSLQVHMNALERMVAMRGGLANLGWGGVLHMVIVWEDLLSSSLTSSPPRFARVRCDAIAGDVHFPNPIATFIPTHGEPEALCVEMTAIFADMRHLTDLFTRKNHHHRSSISGSRTTAISPDPISFSAQRANIAHRLRTFKNRNHESRTTTPLSYQLEALRLSALIYLELVFTCRQSFCTFLRHLQSQLKATINEGENIHFKHIHPQLERGPLTWALWMGGLVALGDEEEAWFARRIAGSMRALWREGEMGSWEAFEGYIRGVTWVDGLRAGRCGGLWERVRRVGEEDGVGWPEVFSGDRCMAS